MFRLNVKCYNAGHQLPWRPCRNSRITSDKKANVQRANYASSTVPNFQPLNYHLATLWSIAIIDVKIGPNISSNADLCYNTNWFQVRKVHDAQLRATSAASESCSATVTSVYECHEKLWRNKKVRASPAQPRAQWQRNNSSYPDPLQVILHII
ncbi:hypothetical protein PUN28_005135 [Cardiocondyla obscurior]|uniref:Uncharacterized protein n=1 Tax=Cardiocondyla obscurior TaxID=286306 RepID=A0AAW2GJ86_9HYME